MNRLRADPHWGAIECIQFHKYVYINYDIWGHIADRPPAWIVYLYTANKQDGNHGSAKAEDKKSENPFNLSRFKNSIKMSTNYEQLFAQSLEELG